MGPHDDAKAEREQSEAIQLAHETGCVGIANAVGVIYVTTVSIDVATADCAAAAATQE